VGKGAADHVEPLPAFVPWIVGKVTEGVQRNCLVSSAKHNFLFFGLFVTDNQFRNWMINVHSIHIRIAWIVLQCKMKREPCLASPNEGNYQGSTKSALYKD
jgi:hypothetical protein